MQITEAPQVLETIDRLRRQALRKPNTPIPRVLATDETPEPTWQGARIIVCCAPIPRPPDEEDPWGLYDLHLHICTPHAASLAELLNEIRDGFDPLIDATNKHAFYSNLAHAALDYQQAHPEGDSEQALLMAVLEEALEMGMELKAN